MILLFYSLIFLCFNIRAEEPQVEVVSEAERLLAPAPKRVIAKKARYVSFSFDNEDITTIINFLAAKKGVNIIIPQGVAAINQKVTIKFDQKITLDQAEQILNYILDMIGYGVTVTDDSYVIKKNDNISREPLPLYVNVPTENLPKAQRIKAIYYLANLRVPENNQGQEPLNLIIRDQLTPAGIYLFDQKSNGIILSDRGDVVASIMDIILRLDDSDSKETIKNVRLYNSTARSVADFIKTQIQAIGCQDNRNIIRADPKSESGMYFASTVRVVADDRTNSIILMGKESALERLSDFIQEYMDAPPDSGKSILHVYDLQYLDAEAFATVLKEIVKNQGIGTGQAQKDATGPQQFFDGVIIVPETYKPAAAPRTVPGTASTMVQDVQEGEVIRGGNRLIVSALHKDWVRIKALIQELDIPQRQVIFEVMIVDLTLLDVKKLATQLRNPSGLQLPPGFNFQSAQIAQVITDTPPTTVAADLLRLLLDPAGQSLAIPQSSGPNNGSLILSVADTNGSGIWNLLALLDGYAETKILSHPFLVTLNNVKAQEVVSDIRRAVGDQSVGEGAVSTIRQDDVAAQLSVQVTPRISSESRLNVQFSLDVTNFTTPLTTSTSNFTRITRQVQINANMNSGQILVVGGLSRTQETVIDSRLPILGQIPIVGWLFRGSNRQVAKTNLAIFICPTVVTPKLTQGFNKYTKEVGKRGYEAIHSGDLFDNLKDPITRWFFAPQSRYDDIMLDNYLLDVQDSKLLDDQLLSRYYHMGVSSDEKSVEEDLKNQLAAEVNPLRETAEMPVAHHH